MKKISSVQSHRLAVAVATILFTSAFVTSCSDDDNEDNTPSVAYLDIVFQFKKSTFGTTSTYTYFGVPIRPVRSK